MPGKLARWSPPAGVELRSFKVDDLIRQTARLRRLLALTRHKPRATAPHHSDSRGLDVDRIREESGKVVKWMQDTAKADGHGVQIDFPQDPAQAGKWQKGYLGGKLAGYQVFSSTESGSKEDRAQPLASQSELGNLYLVRAAWNDAWIAEAVNFPRGDYKDQIDAAARAYARALKRSRRAPPSEGPKVIT